MTAKQERVVLVGVVGMSPAVLTETVWALAHEKTPVIVDEVVAITTTRGESSIREQLLESGSWQRLTDALSKEGLDVAGKLAFGSSDSIRIMGDGSKDFDDIASPQENNIAGDFILKVLRQYTESSDTKLIASIAGGRKTMSALMLSCMSLLGREQDRVCHVLVNAPYEQRLEPPFFFPEKRVTHKQGDKKFPSMKAVPVLSDISFVRVRGWYEQESKSLPASYTHMVSLFRDSALPALNYPAVKIDCQNAHVTIEDEQIKLSGNEFALLYVLMMRYKQDSLPGSWNDLLDEMDEIHDLEGVPMRYSWWHDLAEKEINSDRFNRWANSIKNKLAGIIDRRLSEALIPKLKGRNPLLYPKGKIKIENDWISADIQKMNEKA
jgi:CRISPR-associated protein (TIGR02584 family)